MQKRTQFKIDGREMTEDEILGALVDEYNLTHETFAPPPRMMLPLDGLKNIDAAYHIIENTLRGGGHFIIHADVDQDGVSSCAIMYRYLRHFTDKVYARINEKKQHGLSDSDILGIGDGDTYIIVDAIEDNPASYDRVLQTGASLIVLDHHVPRPDVLAIAKKICLVSSAVDYDNPELSGAGVCLKMCLYCDEQNLTNYADELYDLAACGIVGDVCSMRSPENRFIVHTGINTVGNAAIKKIVGGYTFDSTAIAFSIAPTVNCCVRMGHTEDALRLFLTNDEEEISEIVKRAKAYKDEQNMNIESVLASSERDLCEQSEKFNVLFVKIPSESAPLSGVIASRIVGDYDKPVIVFSEGKNIISGSMRAVGVEDFASMVNDTGLATCDGHPLAAGFKCDKKNFVAFQDAIRHKMANVTLEDRQVATIYLKPSQLTDRIIRNIKLINRISGKDFPKATVLVESDGFEISCMSQGKHLKVVDKSGLLLVKWNDGSWEKLAKSGIKKFTGIGTPETANYGRQKYKQIILEKYFTEGSNNV